MKAVLKLKIMGTLKSISIGQAHETFVTLVKNGMTPEMAKNIAQSDEKAKAVVQIASGDYELVLKLKPRILEFQGELVIPKTQILKAEAFKHRNGGDNQQYHYSNFIDILLVNASSTLKSPGMKINEYKLLKAQNDHKNRDELGGKKVIAVSSYDEVLMIMHHVMQNKKYRDGKANIIYFMHNDVLHYARCRWDGGVWVCTAHLAVRDRDVSRRVFSFAKLKLIA